MARTSLVLNKEASPSSQFKVVLGEEAFGKIIAQADHLGVTHNTLSTLILTEFSRVKPDKVYQALGSIPESLKGPPVRNPARV